WTKPKNATTCASAGIPSRARTAATSTGPQSGTFGASGIVTASRSTRWATAAACAAFVVTTAADAGASRQVSRSTGHRRSSGVHTDDGTQPGADHQPYSCRVVTTGAPTASGSSPIHGENPNADGANWRCTSSGRSARTRRTARTAPNGPGSTATGSTSVPASRRASTRWVV